MERDLARCAEMFAWVGEDGYVRFDRDGVDALIITLAPCAVKNARMTACHKNIRSAAHDDGTWDSRIVIAILEHGNPTNVWPHGRPHEPSVPYACCWPPVSVHVR